ncbi:MAG: hypothetical protein M1829_003369 [Trizodia sp. TS-e1964]|nr:MAG: hypothetical protein M1829_003369 [Trizodia sp. TS-e1964]
MATPAYCLYCFECLSASLENRDFPSLAQVKELWKGYDAVQKGVESLKPDNIGEGETAQDEVQEADSGPLSGQEEDPVPSRIRKPTRLGQLVALGSASSSSSSSSSTSSLPSTPASALRSAAAFSNSSSSSFSAYYGQTASEASSLEEDRPLFVTWNTVSSGGSKSLRGCIGTFEAQELDAGLRSYALTSAFDDTRFSPITKRELPTLEVGVTLLTDFEPADGPEDWEIGTHGLRISFTYHSKRLGATYLPDVALEQGWSKEETLISLMRKAGWAGKRADWRLVPGLQVVRYQGKKAAVGYPEWMAWRRWAKEKKGL